MGGMQITVTVRHDYRSDTSRIAEQLTAGGMHVENVLSTLGMITGSLPEGQRAALVGIEGVESVDEDRQVVLPPPDSDIQ
jgi:hypothetical protein